MKKTLLYILLLAEIMLCACSDSHDEPIDMVNRTVLVYMVANNDLGDDSFDQMDLNEMDEAVKSGALDNGGRLLVYYNRNDGSNTLFEIDRKGNHIVHATYDNLSSGGALDPKHMSAVIDKARTIGGNLPMGLILWSHGTGWMDDNPSNGTHFSFGLDHHTRMSLPNLSKALNGNEFEWIYFDCCHMLTAEVIYELRNYARYFVGSTIELPVYGMPYDKNIPLFFKPGDADLIGAARNTFEYYNSKTSVYERFCTMTVVDADAIDELADATRAVMMEAQPFETEYNGLPYMRGTCTIYDMPHYIRALNPTSGTLDWWESAYSNAILYSAATPKCLNLDLGQFTGLGCYIVRSIGLQSLWNYDKCAWWIDVASYNRQLEID